MINVDNDGNGLVEVWLASHAGRWLLLARGTSSLEALITAERVIRDELVEVQELLHQAKEAERRCESQ